MSAAIHPGTPELIELEPGDRMPNSPLPVAVYRRVTAGTGLEDTLRSTFAANGWSGLWTGAIFGYDHFHSNAHEVVGIASGQAILGLGGPSGIRLDVGEGDVVLIPAGTGHRRVRGSSDFMVIGGFPLGQEIHDIYTDLAECHGYRSRIAAVPLPRHPLTDTQGGTLEFWT